MREAREVVIHMDEHSFEAVWGIVYNILTTKFSPAIGVNAALEVLPLTTYFDLPHLFQPTERYVVEAAEIDEEIALQLAQYAIDTNSEELLKRCIDFFVVNTQSLTLLAEHHADQFWTSISQSSIDIILSKIPSDVSKITARNLRLMRSIYEEDLLARAHNAEHVQQPHN